MPLENYTLYFTTEKLRGTYKADNFHSLSVLKTLARKITHVPLKLCTHLSTNAKLVVSQRSTCLECEEAKLVIQLCFTSVISLSKLTSIC